MNEFKNIHQKKYQSERALSAWKNSSNRSRWCLVKYWIELCSGVYSRDRVCFFCFRILTIMKGLGLICMLAARREVETLFLSGAFAHMLKFQLR